MSTTVVVSYKEKIVSPINSGLTQREWSAYRQGTLHRAWVHLCSVKPCPYGRNDPVKVTITRYYSRNVMDGDNFIMSCKGIRDGIARYLRRDDRESPMMEWIYKQAKVDSDDQKRLEIQCELRVST